MKPIRTTVLFGIFSGMGVIILSLLPVHLWGWPIVIKLYMLLNATIYTILLCRWSRTPLLKIFFPLIMLAGIAFFTSSLALFTLAALAVFSWVRSGLCYAKHPRRALLAEVLTITAGAGSIWLWPPYGPLSLALMICLFFSLQSLYFFLVPQRTLGRKDNEEKDIFEKACSEVESILRQRAG